MKRGNEMKTSKRNQVNPFGPASRFRVKVQTLFNGKDGWVIVDRDHRCPVTGGYKIVSFCSSQIDALETLASMGG